MTVELKHFTADIVSAYVSVHTVKADNLDFLIKSVFRSLSALGEAEGVVAPEVPKLTTTQIKRSVTAEWIISFEDGKSYKSLKRHLNKHGLTPEEYRAKWGLPNDYPMVAPSYSAARSALAKKTGLGASGRTPVAVPEAVPPRKIVKSASRPKKEATVEA